MPISEHLSHALFNCFRHGWWWAFFTEILIYFIQAFSWRNRGLTMILATCRERKSRRQGAKQPYTRSQTQIPHTRQVYCGTAFQDTPQEIEQMKHQRVGYCTHAPAGSIRRRAPSKPIPSILASHMNAQIASSMSFGLTSLLFIIYPPKAIQTS